MVRTQVRVTEQQAALLKELSVESNESIASIIRQALDQYLLDRKPDRRALYRQASRVVGKYNAGISDLSVNHDRYIEDALK